MQGGVIGFSSSWVGKGDFIVEYYVEHYLLRKELCYEPRR